MGAIVFALSTIFVTFSVATTLTALQQIFFPSAYADGPMSCESTSSTSGGSDGGGCGNHSSGGGSDCGVT
jgi:hypothetical protein